jgi:outer membrane receptor protein involved in Fe transport
LTDNDQLQLNYTRRLRRPWGGQLNSFRNTSDATVVSFGNPELTPEFSNSFSFNYLRTWTEHSLLVSAYYRPTSDVMQRINWQSKADGMMYSTSKNVAHSMSSGLELTAKNKFFRILDLSTTANFYYYKLDGFTYNIDGQTVTGVGNDNFTWNARMQASLRLPYDISIQTTGNYRSRSVITQGYRKANYGLDMGIRKNFFNKALTLAINCRDLLDSRKWENYTSSDTFTRHQKNWRGGRRFNITLTWNFGNMKKPRTDREEQDGQNDRNGQMDNEQPSQFGGGED